MAGESDKKPVAQYTEVSVDADEEEDPWDVRINNTGCAPENTKLTDCWHEHKDWRKCTTEMVEFQKCWKKNHNDERTSMKDV